MENLRDRSSCDDGFISSISQLWFHWMDFSRLCIKLCSFLMALSYWLRADVDDLLNEDTFFDSSDYSCLLEDTEWV